MANTITQWKPEATVNGTARRFKTYAKLKRNMLDMLVESNSNEVRVSRSRRGQWGEWFEYWGFDNNRKPVIIKQGWM